MKNPLSYQRTEYDCGPTTLINAISFLFDREDIHPELIKSITTYTTDGYGASGEHGKGGTTRLAMMFISGWLNEFGRSRGFPIETEYLSGMSVRAERGGKLVQALNEGGAVVARVFHEPYEHYVLISGLDGEDALIWDPYFPDESFWEDHPDIEVLNCDALAANFKIPLARIDDEGRSYYNLGPHDRREAVLMFNRKTKLKTEEAFEPDYSI